MSEGTIPLAAAAKFLEQIHLGFAEGDPRSVEKETEAANLRLLIDQYRAIGAGDFATALGLLADDIEMEVVCSTDFAFAGRWKGRGPVAEALGRNFAQVADQHPEVEHVIAQGDTIVLVGREVGRYLPAGKWYTVNWVQIHQFRDGRLVRFRELIGQAAFAETRPG